MGWWGETGGSQGSGTWHQQQSILSQAESVSLEWPQTQPGTTFSANSVICARVYVGSVTHLCASLLSGHTHFWATQAMIWLLQSQHPPKHRGVGSSQENNLANMWMGCSELWPAQLIHQLSTTNTSCVFGPASLHPPSYLCFLVLVPVGLFPFRVGEWDKS